MNLDNKITENNYDDESVLPENIIDFLNKIFDKAKLTNEQKDFLINSIDSFEALQKQKLDYKKEENEAIFENTLKELWGKNHGSNLILIRRALKWLYLHPEKGENNKRFNFFNSLIKLGKMISEDSNIESEGSGYTLSKDEARRKRSQLSQDKNFMEALNSKTHSAHKDAISKLEELNKIIIS